MDVPKGHYDKDSPPATTDCLTPPERMADAAEYSAHQLGSRGLGLGDLPSRSLKRGRL